MKIIFLLGIYVGLVYASSDYNYDNPDVDWPIEYPSCSGFNQSPINLDPKTKNDPRIKRVEFSSDFDEDYEFKVKYFSNQPMVFEATADDVDLPTISGSYFNGEKFFLYYGRIVLGTDSKEGGSEHLIGHRRYPGEIQFRLINTRAILEDNFNPYQDPNGVAVLSYFIKVGNHNYKFEKIIDAMKELDATKAWPTDTTFIINPMDLIPKKAHNFYFYQGSHTYPGCRETVLWHIFTKPIELSEGQLEDLRKLRVEDDSRTIVPDYRPVQDIHLRKVYGHIEKTKSSKSRRRPYRSSRHRRRRPRGSRRPYRPSRPYRPHHSPRGPHPYGSHGGSYAPY
eukprot:TRINITY_DN7174_c0_g1_i1.p1 TRINITY_DN7174_c0_g1~~TRINITY_DN7174_c0_g1_i1.p1  ORF type:complete len:338 (-),score=-20.71 TRINITY_DN7174_c0_g1_i1:107-1120(-)